MCKRQERCILQSHNAASYVYLQTVIEKGETQNLVLTVGGFEIEVCTVCAQCVYVGRYLKFGSNYGSDHKQGKFYVSTSCNSMYGEMHKPELCELKFILFAYTNLKQIFVESA